MLVATSTELFIHTISFPGSFVLAIAFRPSSACCWTSTPRCLSVTRKEYYRPRLFTGFSLMDGMRSSSAFPASRVRNRLFLALNTIPHHFTNSFNRGNNSFPLPSLPQSSKESNRPWKPLAGCNFPLSRKLFTIWFLTNIFVQSLSVQNRHVLKPKTTKRNEQNKQNNRNEQNETNKTTGTSKTNRVKQPERVGETCKKMHLNVTRRDLKIFNL